MTFTDYSMYSFGKVRSGKSVLPTVMPLGSSNLLLEAFA